jgi:hypothetical protein
MSKNPAETISLRHPSSRWLNCDVIPLMVLDGRVMRLREERAATGTGTIFVAQRRSKSACGQPGHLAYRIVKI